MDSNLKVNYGQRKNFEGSPEDIFSSGQSDSILKVMNKIPCKEWCSLVGIFLIYLKTVIGIIHKLLKFLNCAEHT